MKKIKKRKYFRKCGNCDERHEQKEMIRTKYSKNGWLCKSCYEHLLFEESYEEEF